MAIRKSKPTSAGRRFYSAATFEEVTKKTPEKSLLVSKKKTAGRNASGKITVRHIGGGNRQKYRLIDFKRNKDGIPAKVVGIEYDPNRSAYIALLNYVDGEKRYILAPLGLSVGETVMSGKDAEIKVGNALPLENIPVGSVVHNIELNPGKGGQKFEKECLTNLVDIINWSKKNKKEFLIEIDGGMNFSTIPLVIKNSRFIVSGSFLEKNIENIQEILSWIKKLV